MKTKTLLLTFNLWIGIIAMCIAQTTGTFTDPRDGQIYKTITIEDQMKGTSVIWMAQNLNYYNSNVTPKCCAYNYDNGYRKNLGLLYSYEDAQNACPMGWRIPSKEEWQNLIDYFKSTYGDKWLESVKSTFGWETKGTNTSGFNVPPGGYFSEWPGSKLIFVGMGEVTRFWSSSRSERYDSHGSISFSAFSYCTRKSRH